MAASVELEMRTYLWTKMLIWVDKLLKLLHTVPLIWVYVPTFALRLNGVTLLHVCQYSQVPSLSRTLSSSSSLVYPCSSWRRRWASTPARAGWPPGGRFARCLRVRTQLRPTGSCRIAQESVCWRAGNACFSLLVKRHSCLHALISSTADCGLLSLFSWCCSKTKMGFKLIHHFPWWDFIFPLERLKYQLGAQI